MVSVTAADKPVANVRVVTGDFSYKVLGLTGADGTVRLLIPSEEKRQYLAAWHPELGVAGRRGSEKGIPGPLSQLSLLAPVTHTIRVVDGDGKAVPHLKLGVSFYAVTNEWIMTRDIEAARVLTDANGEAIVRWFPREGITNVDVNLFDTQWKREDIQRDKADQGLTTVPECRKFSVQGQLKMPSGESAEGILVSGFGFGHTHQGDIPRARAAADGTFTLRIASDHGYVVDIGDTQWASDGWTGMIMADDTAPPAAITLDVYAATPLKVQVSRGPQHQPVANAGVDFRTQRDFSWHDAQGKRRNATAGILGWLQTDETGTALAGVGKGELRLGLRGPWDEQQTVDVKGNAPVSVEFHRDWLGKRKVTGRLVMNNALHKPSPSVVIHAWAPPKPGLPPPAAIEPMSRADGTFEIEFDAVDLSVLVRDPQQHLSGFAQLGAGDTTVEVAISPTAVYSGVAVDKGGHPLAAKTLRLLPPNAMANSAVRAAEDQMTDSDGKFRFDSVATDIRLRLGLVENVDGKPVRTFGRYFTPGEMRENTRLIIPVGEDTSPPDSLAQRLAKVTRDGRLAGMQVLAIVQGDASDAVEKLTARISDYRDVPEVLGYLLLLVGPETIESEPAAFEQLGWQRPAAGEVVLVAVNGEGKQLGSQRLTASDNAEANQLAAKLIKQHVPPVRDAKARWVAAQEEARRTGRRLWIVDGGPRCGPCFGLARWMDDHHALLEKDYVILKVLDGLDRNDDAVIKPLNPPVGAGIPWFAITEPDGAVLATSDGPLGNIGSVSGVEGVRHFRTMISRTAQRLTPDEQERLAQSLSPSDD